MNGTISYQCTMAGQLKIDRLAEIAIQRLQDYEPEDGYYLAFSGGKDSIVIHDLAMRAGIKFDAHYSQTTVDPPEVQKFIKNFPHPIIWEKPKDSMFRLIIRKKMVPTRWIRFCCSELKEIGGKGRTVITGVRWAESSRRRQRQVYEQSQAVKTKWFLHPIIDWSDSDVWDYIRYHALNYCSLYDVGYDRIGCILCPLQSQKGKLLDIERYPKYYKAYLKAIEHMLNACQESGDPFGKGSTPEEVMHWWIYESDYDTETKQSELCKREEDVKQ